MRLFAEVLLLASVCDCGSLIFLTPSKLTSNLVLNPDQDRSFISWILITIKHTAEDCVLSLLLVKMFQ